ncbi:hypothetical protein FRB93_004035 [Tulasnella sp. JGI-2019a]|nr:hypothetical protein FRB93_004035 [Tulasnella sp. JGI-2019a]
MPKAEKDAVEPPPTEGQYHWPPFPDPPAGKTITPYKQYKPKGIIAAAEDSDDEEVDAEGVKTIKLTVVHVSDPVEKAIRDRAKRAKKRRKGAQGPGLGGVAQGGTTTGDAELSKYWYEAWEDNKPLERVTPMTSMDIRDERFRQIMADFATTHQFPRSVQSIHDNFKIFVGLISSTQKAPFSRRTKGAASNTQLVDGAEDDGDLSDTEMVDVAPVPRPHSPRIEEEIPCHDSTALMEEAMDRFWEDMEGALKLFFTSWSYDKGLMWETDKRRNGPILIEFIIDFMDRHKTFKEKECKEQFDRALKFIAQAKIEQVAVGELADVFPDPFSLACREMWGRWQMSVETGEWVAFKPKPIEPTSTADTPTTDLMEGATILKVGDVKGALDTIVEKPAVDEGGWGKLDTDDSGWGDAKDGEADEITGGDWGLNGNETTTWGQEEPEWNLPQENHTLTTYYSSLPSSHTTVRAEMSVRKLVAVDGPLPNAVSEFRKPVCVVVMAPWPEPSGKPDTYVPFPKMLKDDVSEVVAIPAHDPTKDRIRVYVDPATAERLKDRIGMGFNGYWMQVAQQKSLDETAASDDVPPAEPAAETKTKTKKEQKDSPTNWWYCEDTFQIYMHVIGLLSRTRTLVGTRNKSWVMLIALGGYGADSETNCGHVGLFWVIYLSGYRVAQSSSPLSPPLPQPSRNNA